ncbi:hypothetical protein [Thermosyntropha sp.]|uniref:hypothetical protein n=1 Tax=Thermosyntropha sp. TaxID=2740820 RepID=UPI0025E7727D|nr:hypothetical protein [Thermosyntropha sp.]MBO8158825.1 hypothetical protein [Thermosyntropha sp.]
MLLGATIRLKDQFTTTMGKVVKSTTTLSKEAQKTTGVIQKLTAKMKILGKTVVRPVVKLKDQATSTLNKIKNNLLSLKGLAAGALAAMGLGAVGEATIGTAMKREQQMVSMEHFIGIQNAGISEAEAKKQAKQYVGWLNKYANFTPFETNEVVAVGTRAINIAGGDIAKARELVKIAGDMAALNPEKTIYDAIEALADLRVGETERMKEFGFKITQEDIKKAGGAEAVMLSQVAPFFEGGAKKLSSTTAGLWTTVKGNISTAFTEAGMGIVEGLRPQLQWLVDFFEKKGPTISARMQAVGQAIGKAIAGARDVIKTIKPVIVPLISYIQSQIPAVKSMWKTAWPTISSVLQTAWGIIGPILSIIGSTMKIVWGIFKIAWPGIVAVVSAAWKVLKPIFEAVGRGLGLIAKGVKWVAEKFDAGPTEIKVPSKTAKGHAAGLRYVPYDNYLALLHRGEAVLPRRDADLYRAGGGNVTVAKLADTIVVREDADIDQIVRALEQKLRLAAANRGRVAMA